MTDEEIAKHSKLLYQEASELLDKEGLLPMLKSFGTTQVIGSYTLNMMTWPDIDISMNLPSQQNVELFFEIAKRIATKFQITKMSYSNHFILTRLSGIRPRALLGHQAPLQGTGLENRSLGI